MRFDDNETMNPIDAPSWMTPATDAGINDQPETKGPDPTVERIRAVMARRKMSQADMARYLDVPQGTIANWLLGTRKPSRSVARLLDVLGMIEVLAPGIHEQFLPGK